MRTLYLFVFCCMVVYIKSECTYTDFCKRKFQAQAPNVGHDKEEFCKLIVILDRCIEQERPKCEQGSTISVERFLRDLYSKDPECSGVPSLKSSVVVILLSSLVGLLTFNYY